MSAGEGYLIMVMRGAMLGLGGGKMGYPQMAPTVGASLGLLTSLWIGMEEAEGVPREGE